MSTRVLFAALVALGILTSQARAAEPQAEKPEQELTAPEFQALLQRLADGWNEGDARKAAECFTKDAVYTEPPDKQEYRGRQRLYEFFGGDKGRTSPMRMTWRHVAFDATKQVGLGEFTFDYGSKAHGVVVIRVREGRISNWREYFYESQLDWEEFTERNRF
jgi:ketosteroid isomerase-like protein